MAVSKEICAAHENGILTQKVLASVGKLLATRGTWRGLPLARARIRRRWVSLAGRSGAARGSVARPARASRGV